MLSHCSEQELEWLLVYSKPRAERWADANLRRQGYATLLPWVATARGAVPLFPRYVFVGRTTSQRVDPLRSTSGVAHLLSFGGRPAVVRRDLIGQVRSRMDAHGFATIEPSSEPDALFAARDRARVRTLLKLAEAGYRVRVA